jgi:glyoxylase-like metal-dependent hydrolase (beta-lactamase superfamily II)
VKSIHLLRASALAVMTAITLLGTAGVGVARAAAPMVKTSAPGYFRMMLGDFEVTALSDGTVNLPINQIMTRTTPAQVDKALAKSFLKSPVETSVNGYLINTGTKLVLIDTGAAGLFGPTLGKLLGNLKASGYEPEQVDEIYITHLHHDHVGGLLLGGQTAFLNAVVRVDRHETDYWLSQANMDKAPMEIQEFFHKAMISVRPYVESGRFMPFDGDTELVPGVRSVSSHGHTPGHSTYLIESKGEKLMLWGDLMHVAAVQFDVPSVTILYDTDSQSAAVQRKAAYADAAKQGYIVGAAHISFPGLGHLRANGKGYAWVPINYTAFP